MAPSGAYLANIVDESEVWRFVHRHGEGDRAAAGVAARQLSVITTRQLLLAGLGPGAVAGRRKRGLLTPLHRGVYLWGGGIALPGGRELAGCLACGRPSYASHTSAGALWEMIAPRSGPVEITVLGEARSRTGISVHRTRWLPAADVGDVRGIPVTAPARTLLDLASCLDEDELQRALSAAFARQLLTERELVSVLARGSGHPGAATLRALLDAQSAHSVTRSHAERRLLALVSEAGLPAPRTNVRVEGYLVDAYWPEQKLIVEIDGFAVHGHRGAFERDRRRDQRLLAAGFRIMRITWRQLTGQPMLVVANLARALQLGR
jgi:very-short-patch-repair endonuclease